MVGTSTKVGQVLCMNGSLKGSLIPRPSPPSVLRPGNEAALREASTYYVPVCVINFTPFSKSVTIY